MKEPDKKITRKDLKDYCRSFIYVWMRGSECLYIGATTAGLTRILNHNVIGVKENLLEEDEILIYYAEDNSLLWQNELELIVQLKPRFCSRPPAEFGKREERECPSCRQKFTQKRAWQIYCSNTCSRKRIKIDLS